MRNLLNFHPTPQKSESFLSMGSFCPWYATFDLQKYRGFIFYNTEQWCKIWINPDLANSKMTRAIGWTFIRALKSQKNCNVMGCFYLKHIMFQLENFIVSWHWRVMQNLKENWVVAWQMTEEIWLIFMRAVKNLKICTLMGSFCPKHLKV